MFFVWVMTIELIPTAVKMEGGTHIIIEKSSKRKLTKSSNHLVLTAASERLPRRQSHLLVYKGGGSSGGSTPPPFLGVRFCQAPGGVNACQIRGYRVSSPGEAVFYPRPPWKPPYLVKVVERICSTRRINYLMP